MRRLRKRERSLALLGTFTLVVVAGATVYAASVVRRGFSARDEPSSIEVIVARAVRNLAIPARAMGLRNPLGGTPDVLSSAM
jgi:hypothetical protein